MKDNTCNSCFHRIWPWQSKVIRYGGITKYHARCWRRLLKRTSPPATVVDHTTEPPFVYPLLYPDGRPGGEL